MTAREIAHAYGVHRQIVGGGWLKLPRGAVTDDTTMSLALGRAIVQSGGWNLAAVAASFATWLHDRPIDCGNTCRRGIQRYLGDGSLSGPPSEGDGGNGALMRNLPVVLAELYDEAALLRHSLEQGRVTHHHRHSDAAICAFARLLCALIRGEPAVGRKAIADELVAAHPAFRFEPYPGRSSAYVVDTAQTVLHYFFAREDFEDCVVATVNQGGDADTTGALAAMLAGARCGARALPPRWLRALDAAVVTQIRAQTAELLAIARRAARAG